MENKIDPNQPAFSRSAFAIDNWEDCDRGAQGLTIRQYYAGLAMAALAGKGEAVMPETDAALAVQYADALIAELNKEQ